MLLDIDRGSIHIIEPVLSGTESGPSLLFIHGAGGNGSHWDHQADYFKGKCAAYRIDLPGHGGSSPPGEASISAYAQWTRKAMEQIFSGHDVVLVGHSMGGAIVLELTTGPFPNLKGIVVVGTGAKLGVMPEIFEWLDKDPEAFFETIDLAAFHSDTPRKIRKPAIQAIRKCPPSIIFGDFKACDHFDIRERLKEIRVPALILCGDRDKLTPVKYSKYLHENLPKAQLEIIPGAGHMVMVEQAEATNRVLEDFVLSLGA